MKKRLIQMLLPIALFMPVSGYAQQAKVQELENAILRRAAVVNSDKDRLTLSVSISDYLPAYGFDITISPPITSIQLSNPAFDGKNLKICIATDVSFYEWAKIEKVFGSLGYIKSNPSCSSAYVAQTGLANKQIGYFKIIDLSKVTIPSNHAEYLNTTDFTLKQKTASKLLLSTESSFTAQYSTVADLHQSTCAQGSYSPITAVTSLLADVCASLTPEQQLASTLTYGIKIRSVEQSAENIHATACSDFIQGQTCTVTYNLIQSGAGNRKRFYGPKFMWKQYAFVSGPGLAVESYIKDSPQVLGIYVK